MTLFILFALVVGAVSWFVRSSQQQIHIHERATRPKLLQKWYENQNQVTKETLKRFV